MPYAKKVHKSLKFSRGSFWTSERIKSSVIPHACENFISPPKKLHDEINTV